MPRKCRGIRDQHASLHLLWLLSGSLPEEAIFLQQDYSLTGLSRSEMIYNKEKLLSLGGEVGGIQKWN